jgi:serine/threonine-protein kinase
MAEDPKAPFNPNESRDDARRPFTTTGPSLDADGRLVNLPPSEAPTEGVAGQPAPAEEEPPLELAERTRKHVDPTPDSYRPLPPPAPRRGPLLFAVLVGVAAVLLAGLLLAPREWRRRLPVAGLDRLIDRDRPAVVITSDPSGASVRIGDQVVGTTPWASNNLWGDAPVTIELKGYRPWKGRLTGGRDVTLSATLTR